MDSAEAATPAGSTTEGSTTAELITGYAELPSGVRMYYERRGSGLVPLIVTHGGFGLTTMFGGLLDRLAEDRLVIAVELQGHGHTADIDRPFSFQAFGDDLADLIEVLGHPQADLLGYSLGGSASLRAAIQHPDRVRRLAVISDPIRRTGWHPEVIAGMDQISSAGLEQLKQTPVYAGYAAVAPDPGAFATLMDRTGALLGADYDWTADAKSIGLPTLLVYGDADSVPIAHAAEFYALLGGGLSDAGWMDPDLGPARLAVLPGATHYDILSHPGLPAVLTAFFAEVPRPVGNPAEPEVNLR